MRSSWDLSGQPWVLRGWRPNDWRWETSFARFDGRIPDVPAIPVSVPGSVRGALVAAGIVASPYAAVQSRESEWIENRHWSFTTELPDGARDAARAGERVVVRAGSLDFSGTVLVDDAEVGTFRGALAPVVLDITDAVRAGGSSLTVVFTTLPEDLSQIGWTSRIRDWKARFNYGWDWTPRVVQVGIAAPVVVEASAGVTIEQFDVVADFDPETGTGLARYRGRTTGAPANSEVVVEGPGVSIREPAALDGDWHELTVPGVQPWVVHPDGLQSMYTVRVRAAAGGDSDERARRVGFRSVRWLANEGAPEGAEPWILALNGEPTFLAGVNWVPVRPDYADVSEDDYLIRLHAYRDIGINLLRVWGGAARESDAFYDLADELGFLVWQEFPLSSSGLDNLPPDDEAFCAEFAEVAGAYVEALSHHPSIVLWGGGNELAAAGDQPIPATIEQPALAAAGRVVADADPTRRYVPTSPLGPRAWAFEEEYGKGLHHDVHGPWSFDGPLEDWRRYWDGDDALLRSEVGVDGASDLAMLERYGLTGPTGTAEERERLAELWAHSSAWWLKRFRAWDGKGTLAEWVEENQARQADMLAYAAASARKRFPRCGGFIVWLGHDTFPCPVSLALLDFDGTAKPVARALARVFGGAMAS
jgi:beta-mannosidase